MFSGVKINLKGLEYIKDAHHDDEDSFFNNVCGAHQYGVLHDDDVDNFLVMPCVQLRTPIMTGSYIMMTRILFY